MILLEVGAHNVHSRKFFAIQVTSPFLLTQLLIGDLQ
jgi:hypothetical protein